MASLSCSLFYAAFFSLLVISANCLSFSYNFTSGGGDPRCSGDQTSGCIIYQRDAIFNGRGIDITTNRRDVSIARSVGRAVYGQPMILWDPKTGELADFNTHFSFTINALNSTDYGDGIAFFLSSWPSVVPNVSYGGPLGLFNDTTKLNKSVNRIVAVEFDTNMNEWDISSDHLGIDVNSIDSVKTVNWTTSMKDARTANAWVSYDGTTQNLSVFLTYANNPRFNGSWTISHNIDLRQVFNQSNEVAFGFSASTGDKVELHTILSWEFSSSIDPKTPKKKNKLGLIIGLVVAIGLMVGIVGVVWFVLWKKKNVRDYRGDDDEAFDASMDYEFEQGRGPKRFPYSDLAGATKNFAAEGKLGEGGFGAVYKGFLKDLGIQVAIKRISRGSRQGKKEYIAEVKIISQLRHRNLVQLVGWCHDRGDLLLVYEFMPNGSLDTHLYSFEKVLTWPLRFKIVLGLASALLYLHEEWEQCVVHRDIKPSNVMLDSMFNSKLGDFGLARLVDHERGSQTTVLAGTMGYLAPECVTTGKASKESDVYSFGVLCLEIACGRRPVEPKETVGRVGLVEMVWNLYGKNAINDAVDARLNSEFDEEQMVRMMVVGLWCAHPDFNFRPPIRQVISVLNSDAPLPKLPAKMPVPMYYAPPMDAFGFTGITTSGTGSSGQAITGSSYGMNSSSSTGSQQSSSSVLLLNNARG